MEAPAERNGVNQIILTGIVLSTMPVGEYDRRVVILTKRTGKDLRRLHGGKTPEQSACRCAQPVFLSERLRCMREDVLHDTVGSISNYFAELRGDIIGHITVLFFWNLQITIRKNSMMSGNVKTSLSDASGADQIRIFQTCLSVTYLDWKALTINGQAYRYFSV